MESIKQKTLQEQLKQSQDTVEKLQNSLKVCPQNRVEITRGNNFQLLVFAGKRKKHGQ